MADVEGVVAVEKIAAVGRDVDPLEKVLLPVFVAGPGDAVGISDPDWDGFDEKVEEDFMLDFEWEGGESCMLRLVRNCCHHPLYAQIIFYT